jgi:DNA-binding NarL/FixJ family response regulator
MIEIMAAPIRVLLIEPCRLFAEALEVALGGQDKILLVGAISHAEQALVLITKLDVNLVLVQAGSEHLDSVGLVRRIRTRHPQKDVIVMGIDDFEESILEHIEAGASGYVLKSASATDVFATIEAVHEGRTQCPPRILAAVFNRVRQLSRVSSHFLANPPDRLSPREKEILEMIALGLVNKEIARRLGITVCTVKNHVHNILEKLRVNHRHAAVHYASLRGMLHEPIGRLSSTARARAAEI